MSGPAAEGPVPPDIVAFVRARIAEDAAEIAKHPGDGDWPAVAGCLVADEESNYPCAPFLRIGKDRALREVEAKRRIVDAYEESRTEASDLLNRRAHGAVAMAAIANAGALSLVLQDLAAVWSDHPDYREEWRP